MSNAAGLESLSSEWCGGGSGCRLTMTDDGALQSHHWPALLERQEHRGGDLEGQHRGRGSRRHGCTILLCDTLAACSRNQHTAVAGLGWTGLDCAVSDRRGHRLSDYFTACYSPAHSVECNKRQDVYGQVVLVWPAVSGLTTPIGHTEFISCIVIYTY